MKYAPRWLPVGLLSLTALAACTDQLDAPTASLRAESPLQARGPLRDGDLDRSDTHFGARVVTTTERHDGEALLSSGDPLLTASQDEVYLEGGYGTDGRIRFSVYFESVAASPGIGLVRLVGSELQTFDRMGTRLRTELADDAMAVAGLPGGDHAMAYFSSAPPICPPEAPECTVAAPSLQADAVADSESDVRVMRVRPLAARGTANANDVVIEQRFRRVRRANSDAAEAWRVEEIRRTNREAGSGREHLTTVVTRFNYRSWDRNEKKEQGRERARAVRVVPPAAVPASGSPKAASLRPSVLARQPDPTAEATFLGGVCQQGTAEFDRVRTSVSRGYNIVYQHGFCSDASVFYKFDERLAQAIALQRGRAFSLASTDRIEAQTRALLSRLSTKTGDRPLLIGHSQGGLVARRLGQLAPERVSGVITIGTPHLGSILAGLGPDLAEEYLERVIRRDCFTDIICDWIDEIVTDFTSGILLFGRDGGAPALQDLAPGSPFLRALNSSYEIFPRVSIEVSAGNRWALARMVGDARSSPDRLMRSERPGGEARVKAVQDLYVKASWLHYLSATAIFTSAAYSVGVSCDRSGYSTLWPSCRSTAWNSNLYWNSMLLLYLTYELTGIIIDVMNGIDRTWDEMTTARIDETDGLIHLSSQRYPVVPGMFTPQRVSVNPLVADSHKGHLKSPGVFGATLEAIARMGGQPK